MASSTERMRRWREKNRIKAAYKHLQHNAKRRGKEFTITIEEFEKFCTETEYIGKKGIRKDSLTVDRIDETKGYVPGNIQALTNSDNIRKKLVYDKETKRATVVTVRKTEQQDEPPF